MGAEGRPGGVTATGAKPVLVHTTDPLSELIRELRRPFAPGAIKWKIQTNPKDENGRALIVSFIDARSVAERLNYVCPGAWSDEYMPVAHNGDLATSVRCRLSITVDGRSVIREDVGTLPQGTDEVRIKGGYSDALKRAAVKFGIGAFLYALPKQYLSAQNDLRKWQGQGGRVTWFIQPPGEAKLRAAYEAWLESAQAASFGAVLDHGESLDEQGDVEVVVEAAPGGSVTQPGGSEQPYGSPVPPQASDVPADFPLPAPEPAAAEATGDVVTETIDPAFACDIADELRVRGCKVPQFRRLLEGVGVDPPEDMRAKETRLALLSALTHDQARRLVKDMNVVLPLVKEETQP